MLENKFRYWFERQSEYVALFIVVDSYLDTNWVSNYDSINEIISLVFFDLEKKHKISIKLLKQLYVNYGIFKTNTGNNQIVIVFNYNLALERVININETLYA